MALVGPRVLNYLSEVETKDGANSNRELHPGARPVQSRNGRYPTSSEGLSALVQRPGNASSWNGPYIKTATVPADLGAGVMPTGRRRIMHPMKSLPMARPGSPADRAPPPRSRAPLSSRAMKRDDAGFTLIEIVCVLAIIALLAGLALLSIIRATSGPRLEAYALQAATILTADRNAAIRRHAVVASVLDLGAGTICSGAGAGRVQFPRDVAFDALLARTCNGRTVGATIDFFPDGMSCGGTVGLRRGNSGYQIGSTGSREASRLYGSTARSNRYSSGFTLVEVSSLWP